MNYYDIIQCMHNMGANQKKYEQATYTSIINAIISFYMADEFFTLDDCIRVFQCFLTTGAIIWYDNKYNERKSRIITSRIYSWIKN